ncbi:MAG: hypothetical protein IPM37_21690 [Hahellaceae bacterium]|nr:hypothetical protein [Hahellaceae bacterium]
MLTLSELQRLRQGGADPKGDYPRVWNALPFAELPGEYLVSFCRVVAGVRRSVDEWEKVKDHPAETVDRFVAEVGALFFKHTVSPSLWSTDERADMSALTKFIADSRAVVDFMRGRRLEHYVWTSDPVRRSYPEAVDYLRNLSAELEGLYRLAEKEVSLLPHLVQDKSAGGRPASIDADHILKRLILEYRTAFGGWPKATAAGPDHRLFASLTHTGTNRPSAKLTDDTARRYKVILAECKAEAGG